MVTRRDFLAAFLAGAGCFVVGAGAPLPARARAAEPGPGRVPRYRFPQGVASGDPTPESVVLWTRVEAADGSRAPVPVTVQVAALPAGGGAPDFTRVVAEQAVTAAAESDHTVRVLVTGLAPDTRYAYRFLAGSRAGGGDATGPDPRALDASPLVGRTRTAPLPNADRPVRLAFASCQAYEGGYYGAWRTLVNEDLARPEAEQLDFVLHLGDFIYEALGYGGARRVPPFPSGGAAVDTGSGKRWANVHAVTLDDYRHLYKTYLADPDLQAARARWPFVVTWDDHEFTDDCWQAAETYAGPPAPAQRRKLAANRAWFEFVPALLTGAPSPGGAPGEARDFRDAAVADAPLGDSRAAPGGGGPAPDGLPLEPNARAAVGSMTIYRSFRWGRHAELVVGDNRSYRTEHAVPAELATAVAGTARYLVPLEVVRVFDAGRACDGGRPPAAVRVGGPGGGRDVPNVRRDAEPGTMLGARQKAWWKATMQGSTATWKLWANSVPLMPLRLDLDALGTGLAEAVFTVDSWEGYQHERAELGRFLAERGVANVVSLTGDHHNNFAGLVPNDAAPGGPAPMAEFAVTGVSSASVWEAFRGSLRPGDPRAALVVDSPAARGQAGPDRPALNVTWLWGTRASAVLARTGDVRAAHAARNPRQNPHLRYCDSASNGIATAAVYADRVEAELVTIEAPATDRGPAGARVLRRARFTLPAWRPGEGARLAEPAVAGEPPFPLDVLRTAAGRPGPA